MGCAFYSNNYYYFSTEKMSWYSTDAEGSAADMDLSDVMDAKEDAMEMDGELEIDSDDEIFDEEMDMIDQVALKSYSSKSKSKSSKSKSKSYSYSYSYSSPSKSYTYSTYSTSYVPTNYSYRYSSGVVVYSSGGMAGWAVALIVIAVLALICIPLCCRIYRNYKHAVVVAQDHYVEVDDKKSSSSSD